MGGVQLRLILGACAFILGRCMSSAQLCPTVVSRDVSINRTQAVVVSSDEIDQPPANCTSATLELNFTIKDNGSLTSIDILELRNDHPDLELVVELFTTDDVYPTLVVREDTYKRLIIEAGKKMPRLRLTLFKREIQVNGSYSFRARLSLTNEADCGDELICQQEDSLKVCLNPSAVCDGQVHCNMDYSDERNCDYCGQPNFDLEINQEVSIQSPDVTSYLCVWQFKAPPSSRMLLRSYNNVINGSMLVVSLSKVTFYEAVMGGPRPYYVIFQPFGVGSSVHRKRVVKNDAIWVIFGNAIFGNQLEQPVFNLRVTALNESVTCSEDEFQCDTGIQCISNNTRCDGLPNCDDYSDEIGCSDMCQPKEFACNQGSYEQCFSSTIICDNYNQCDDLRDEIGCAPSCGSHALYLQQDQTHQLVVSPNDPASYPNIIKCIWLITAPPGTAVFIQTVKININVATLTVGNGRLVDQTRIIWERRGGTAPLTASSEGNEVWATLDDYKNNIVENAYFILELSILDQLVNCSGDYEVACKSRYQCVNKSNLCDGIFHCWDRSDELSCGQCDFGLPCEDNDGHQFCLPEMFICNGSFDCKDFMDEIPCSSLFCGSERYINLEDYPDNTYNISSLETGFPPQTACLWIFTAKPGYRVLLDVKHQNITNDGTVTTVGSGVDPTNISSQLVSLGGYSPQMLIASLENSMWMTFRVEHIRDGKRGPLWYRVQEFNDTVPCEEGKFRCDSRVCIPGHLQCDGITNCEDLSDEIGCDICNGQSTINITDDQVHTLRANIEEDSIQFPYGKTCVWQIVASVGHRIKLTIVEFDSKYPSEKPHFTFCDGTRFTTGQAFHAFSPIAVTSKTNNVLVLLLPTVSYSTRFTLELEQFQPLECGEGDVVCPSGLACIPEHKVCDGTPQCPLLGDEVGCDECSSDDYLCEGRCIREEQRCNGVGDCTDFSDEYNCYICNGQSTINITDDQVHYLRANIEEDGFKFPIGKMCVWQVLASLGHRIQLSFVELDFKLTPWNEKPFFIFSDGTRYTTEQEFYNKNKEITYVVTSKTNNVLVLLVPLWRHSTRFTVELEQFKPSECGEGDVVCPSGLACIPEHEVCDGTPQCPLLGDEVGCGYCNSDEYRCDDVCISEEQRCDKAWDCTDLSDEYNCHPCGITKIVLQNETATSSPLATPKYTNNYMYLSYELYCFWVITADPNAKISFDFSLIDLVLYYDLFIIGNGAVALNYQSEVVELTGNLSSCRVLTRTSEAWAYYQSRGSVTAQGFSCTISQINPNGTGFCRSDEFTCEDTSAGTVCLGMDEFCNGHGACNDLSDELNCGRCGTHDIYVFDEQINFTSPGFPDHYPLDTICTWQVIPYASASLVFRVVEFVLEEGYDFLRFSIGDPPDLREVLELTGKNIKITRFVLKAPVRVNFSTDWLVADRGFFFVINHLDGEKDCDFDDFDCGNGICIDPSAECNGFNDCRNNRDEYDCDDVVCPNAYKCKKPFVTDNLLDSSLTTHSSTMPSTMSSSSDSSNTFPFSPSPDGYGSSRCVSEAKVCDGNFDCPVMDDETKCDVNKCPADCECNYREGDLNVTCANGWNSTLLSGVARTTKLLQLSGVNISSLEPGFFRTMTNLKVLSLKNNDISEIKPNTFASLDCLLWLDLSNTSLVELQERTFLGMPSLKGITIFDVPLETVRDDAFNSLPQLETLILVRQDSNLPRLKFGQKAFDGLVNLKRLYVDDHRICCFFKDKNVDCKTLEPEPPLFMCSTLMPNLVLKISMWILGISALVGNIFVMIWRCHEETEGRDSRKVHSLLVFNLAASDSLMGLYMMIIAIADVRYGDTYFEQSSEWQTSIPCRLAGFISIVASEASVFFLTLISIERFLAIVYPFSSRHIRPKMGRIISASIWICTLIVGVVPTILAFDSSSDLYGLSDVCIGLPLMTKVARYETRKQIIDAGGVANITVEIPHAAEYRASWFFSIALFLGVNLLCFAVILICYVCMFASVKTSRKEVRRYQNGDDEVRMAIKMAAIVMTDFVCWIPVIVMGILSQSRIVEIPPETYAWVVVFILPINSSLNPYLYTIADLCSKRHSDSYRKKVTPNTSSYNEYKSSISKDTSFTIDAETKRE
ncbi:uncharacterized protein [Asterias amurensis]